MRSTIKTLIVYFIFCFNLVPNNIVNVYTIQTITSKDYGFAEPLKKLCKKRHNITLNFISFNSSADMLMRMKIEGDQTQADMVIGLDYYHMEDAKDLNLFTEHNVDASDLYFPILWGEEQFLPYEFGYLAFLYKKSNIQTPPKSFEDLINCTNDAKIVIANPYTSIPGFGLVLWIKDIYGSKSAKIWRGIKNKLVSVTKSWTQAYILFSKGEANMMLSYSNDALHLLHIGKNEYEVAFFEDGQYLQSSLMAIVKHSQKSELSKKVLLTMISPEMQKIAIDNTWMYPVVESVLPAMYPKINITRSVNPRVATMNRRSWVREWRSTLSKLPS